MDKCARCGVAELTAKDRYCGPCRAAYMREYRKRDKRGKRRPPLSWEAMLAKWSRAVP